MIEGSGFRRLSHVWKTYLFVAVCGVVIRTADSIVSVILSTGPYTVKDESFFARSVRQQLSTDR